MNWHCAELLVMAGALGPPTRDLSNLDEYRRIEPCNSVGANSDDSDGIFDYIYIYIYIYKHTYVYNIFIPLVHVYINR